MPTSAVVARDDSSPRSRGPAASSVTVIAQSPDCQFWLRYCRKRRSRCWPIRSRVSIAGWMLLPVKREGSDNGDDYDHRRHRDLLQGLGPEGRPAAVLPSWLAAERRRLGQPDDVLPRAGISGDRA